MRTFALIGLTLLAGGCRMSSEQANLMNDTRRQEELIVNQADALRREAENRTSAIEQAMENDTAEIFRNRDALLNEAGNTAEAAENKAR